jgi:hypothetical protein
MRRSTLVLLVLLAALGLLYWYLQRPGNVIKQALATSTATAPPVLPNLVKPDQGPVSQIAVQDADGKTVVLRQAGGIWLVTAGEEAPANQEFAESVAQSVLALRVVTRLENSSDLAGMGLTPPAYTVSLVLADGSPYTFKVGAPTATQSGYYVQAGDGSLVVIDKYALDTLATLVIEPPFLQTTTPSPAPATETPIPTVLPETTPEPGVTPTTKP